MMYANTRSFKTISAMVVVAVAITGCVNPRATYISAQDPCSQFREAFVQIKEAQQQQIKEWAATGGGIGAAGGVVAGAAVARKNNGNVLVGALVGGLIGVAAGALAGAALGYYNDLQKRKSSTSALRNAVFSDANSDARTGDRLLNAVVDLNTCRLKSIEQVAADIQRGALREEARARLAQIEAASDADNTLITSVTEGLDDRNKIYVNALAKSGAENPDAYIASVNTYEPVVQPAVFTVARAGGSTLRRNANIRSGPGTGNRVVATLPRGTSVSVVRREGGWSLIDYGDGQGYTANSNFRSGSSGGTARAATIRNKKRSKNGVTRSAARTKEIDAVQRANSNAIKQSLQDTELLLSA